MPAWWRTGPPARGRPRPWPRRAGRLPSAVPAPARSSSGARGRSRPCGRRSAPAQRRSAATARRAAADPRRRPSRRTPAGSPRRRPPCARRRPPAGPRARREAGPPRHASAPARPPARPGRSRSGRTSGRAWACRRPRWSCRRPRQRARQPTPGKGLESAWGGLLAFFRTPMAEGRAGTVGVDARPARRKFGAHVRTALVLRAPLARHRLLVPHRLRPSLRRGGGRPARPAASGATTLRASVRAGASSLVPPPARGPLDRLLRGGAGGLLRRPDRRGRAHRPRRLPEGAPRCAHAGSGAVGTGREQRHAAARIRSARGAPQRQRDGKPALFRGAAPPRLEGDRGPDARGIGRSHGDRSGRGGAALMEPRYSVGIDLGTTNSAVAEVDLAVEPAGPGEPLPAPIPVEIPQMVARGETAPRELLPSFIYLPPAHEALGDFIVGTYARERGAQVPGRLVSSSKSWLSHPGVDRRSQLLPQGGDPEAPRISPLEAAARILGQVREGWDAAHAHEGISLEHQAVTLTVPASFDAAARELTVQAAAQAGLASVTLLEEPQAALYAWVEAAGDSWRKHVRPGDVILVVDVGGGTSDFSLIAVGEELKAQGTRLDSWQFAALTHACRGAKESGTTALAIPGRGSGLVGGTIRARSEEHTSELQSHLNLVC